MSALRSSFVLFSLMVVFVVSGCNGNAEGPSLFNDTEDLTVSEGDGSGDTSGVTFEDGDEFGYTLEGSQCVKQIHSGCVPYDYMRYQGNALGLHFMYPSDWNVTAASEREVIFTPRILSGETDPTRLFAWRENGINPAYAAANTTLLEDGTGSIGDYAVKWEIYEGEWEGAAVKTEWIWLTFDETEPLANYAFFLITETENFDADQAAIKAAASSIVEEVETE